MDVLSELLECIRVRAVLSRPRQICGLAARSSHSTAENAGVSPASASGLVELGAAYHIYLPVSGAFQILTDDQSESSNQLEPGDLFLLRLGMAHKLRRAEGHLGPAAIIFGELSLEGAMGGQLAANLPGAMRVDGRTSKSLGHVIDFLASQDDRDLPGHASVVNSLARLLVCEVARAHLTDLAKPGVAFLDSQIGPILARIHSAPNTGWTVAALADEAAMSRSAFAERFTRLVGEPPLQYLTRCRLERAAELLRAGGLGVKEAAARVGYDSEAAFSSAFKRHHGIAPGSFRRRDLGEQNSPPAVPFTCDQAATA